MAAGTAALAPPVHPVGTGTLTALHASGYEQPGIGVGPGALSLVLNQPSAVGSITFPFESVNVGTGRVTIDPVEVYTGSSDAGTPGVSSVTGGHGYSVA